MLNLIPGGNNVLLEGSKIHLRRVGPNHTKYIFTVSSTLNKRFLLKETKVKFCLVSCVQVYSVAREDFWAVFVL